MLYDDDGVQNSKYLTFVAISLVYINALIYRVSEYLILLELTPRYYDLNLINLTNIQK